MANFLSPIGNGVAFVDSNGNPLSGALLFTYLAGSTTKKTTYKDSAGAASHTNPIVLDANGRPPNPIWLIGSSVYKFVLAPSTDTDPPTSSIYTWDNVSGINDTAATGQDQWVSGPVPTFVDANTFTLVGDQTSNFHVGRRVKLTVSAGTVYGYISVSAFTTLTSIDVVLDSGALDSGLSAVSYALLTSTNQSFPNRVATTDTAQTLTNKTVNLSSNTLTGTTAQFNEANSDSDFYTQGGGDVAITDGGTGASTAAAARTNLGLDSASNDASLPLITFATAAASATLDFTSGITSSFNSYLFVLSNISLSVDGGSLNMRLGDAVNGFYTTGYQWHVSRLDSSSAAYAAGADTASTIIEVLNNIGNAANESGSGFVWLLTPGTNGFKRVIIDVASVTAAGNSLNSRGSAISTAQSVAVDRVRFLPSSGNISSGTIYMFGLRIT